MPNVREPRYSSVEARIELTFENSDDTAFVYCTNSTFNRDDKTWRCVEYVGWSKMRTRREVARTEVMTIEQVFDDVHIRMLQHWRAE